MSVKIIIPARLDSVRLPRKLLLPINNMTMIENVWLRCIKAIGSSEVFVATADEEISELISKRGGQIVTTSNDHENGTSRASEAAELLNIDDVLIIQGDEPLISIENIRIFINKMEHSSEGDVFCGVTELNCLDDLDDIDIVKCSTDINGRIMFIFRKSPFNNPNSSFAKKIQGMIGFKHKSIHSLLLKIPSIGISESIEQLILLENGIQLQEIVLSECAPSVNTLQEYENMLKLAEQ